MLDFVLCMLALVAGGLVLELFTAARAPLGYQDEQGFHFRLPTQQGPDASVLAAATVRPVPATTAVPVNASLQPAHSAPRAF